VVGVASVKLAVKVNEDEEEIIRVLSGLCQFKIEHAEWRELTNMDLSAPGSCRFM
jgi:hypothetical protein